MCENKHLTLSSVPQSTPHHGPSPAQSAPSDGHPNQQYLHEAPQDKHALVSLPHVGAQEAINQNTQAVLNIFDQNFQAGHSSIQEAPQAQHADNAQATYDDTERRRRRRNHRRQDQQLFGVGSQFGPTTGTSSMPVYDQGMANDLQHLLAQCQSPEDQGLWAGAGDEEALQQQEQDATGHLLFGVGSQLQ